MTDSNCDRCPCLALAEHEGQWPYCDTCDESFCPSCAVGFMPHVTSEPLIGTCANCLDRANECAAEHAREWS